MIPKIAPLKADPFAATYLHPLDRCPYRTVVFSGFDQNDAPVFWVAGEDASLLNALNALKKAIKVHGGHCFYCWTENNLNIEHIVPKKRGGSDEFDNLLVSCKPCNAKKGCKSIEEFDPAAARHWLKALAMRANQRIERLNLAR